MSPRNVVLILLAFAVVCSHSARTEDAAALMAKPQLRRPVAMALADGGRWLFTANRTSGSISVIDTAGGKVVDEVAVGKQLSDLAITPDEKLLLVTDEAAGAVLLLKRHGSKLALIERTAVSAYPVSLVIESNGRRAYVTSLWSRTLTAIALDATTQSGESARQLSVLPLPFAPRELLLVRNETRLIVADGFGGRLAIVDPAELSLLAVRHMPAHNIRGLSVNPDGGRLLVAHQILNDLAETSHNDVHWGVLMSNVLRWLVLDHVLDPGKDILKGSHVHLTGDTTTPGADPSGIAMTTGGSALVALAGAHEIGWGGEQDYSLYRLPVGRRPTSIVVAPDDQTAYVSNTFSDSITTIRLQPAKIPPARATVDVHLGPQPTLTEIEQGELLFYDATLALDGWFSCHSCHTDGHSNGQLTDTLGDRSFGAAKRVLSLLGTSETGPWAWDGSMPTIEEQIRKSIRSTMQGSEPRSEQLAALAAYVKSLPPPPKLPLAIEPADAAAIARGRQIFDAQQCAECHRPPLYTSSESYDVGMADKLGNRIFNPPSLVGVRHRQRLFHDNRAASLSEVFSTHHHPSGAKLDAGQIDDLVAFLRSL